MNVHGHLPSCADHHRVHCCHCCSKKPGAFAEIFGSEPVDGQNEQGGGNRYWKSYSKFVCAKYFDRNGGAPNRKRGLIEEKYSQEKFPENYTKSFEEFDVKTAFEEVFKLVTEADLFMQTEEPFKVVKVDEQKGKEMLEILRKKVYTIGRLLNPFMPETSKLIKTLVIENKMPEKPLFPRYE